MFLNISKDTVLIVNGGTPDFGNTVTATISRNGDLIWKIYLELDLPVLAGTGTQSWVKNVGNVLIQQVYVDIGGQTIDTHYGVWLLTNSN